MKELDQIKPVLGRRFDNNWPQKFNKIYLDKDYHVEAATLLQRVSNTITKTITLDVKMENHHRLKSGTEVRKDVAE